jgi:hypothetical protein
MSDHTTSDFQRLMASVGYLMFHWSLLEDGLADDIRRLRTESEGGANLIRVRGTFADWLREWRGLLSQKTRRKPELAEIVADLANEMEHLRQKRNLIAHEFAGASARTDEGEAHIWCGQRDRTGPNPEVTRFTQAELSATISAIDRCRARIRTIEARDEPTPPAPDPFWRQPTRGS